MAQLHLFDKRLAALLLVLGGLFQATAQDPVFSQFNLNKNYTNPAYAGYTEHLSLALHSRIQWSHVPGAFNTNTFNANMGCSPSHIGFGLYGYDHVEGEGFLRKRKADAQISVNFPGRLAHSWGRRLSHKKFIISTGLGLGVAQRSIDWSKLTFTDQYSAYEGYLGTPSLMITQNDVSNVIFDMSAGMRFQLELNRKGSYLSFGAAMFHLNRPVETFFNMDNRMDPRYTAHFFTYFQTKKFANKPNYLSVGMILDRQQGMLTNTLMMSKDVETYGKISLGFRRQNFLLVDQNVDALIMQGLVTFGNFTLGYSYDITISRLGPHRTFGTHEIGLAYVFDNISLCSGRSRGRKRKKSNDDCFSLMEDISPAFRDLYLWNP